MRTIGVVTVARSDYGLLRPVLREITARPDLELKMLVGGMHLSPEFGLTVREVEADGWPIAGRVEMLLSSDTPEGIAKSVGVGVSGFAQLLASTPLDLLVLLGDRFEMMAAGVAALPFDLPIAHIHGGERTEGLIDEAIRHSLTKISHLHLVATDEYRRRVIQLGEEPWRVTTTGAPGLDNVRDIDFMERADLGRLAGLDLARAPLLVTFHPVTLESSEAHAQTRTLLDALATVDLPVVITYPNADTSGRAVLKALREFAEGRADVALVENLGTRAYFSLMRIAAAMAGNSSSGLIESGSFELPVLNIGRRQQGRVQGPNVVSVAHEPDAIAAGLRRVLDPAFRAGLRGMSNPYGDGRAAARIVDVLANTPIDRGLLVKRFHDLDRNAVE